LHATGGDATAKGGSAVRKSTIPSNVNAFDQNHHGCGHRRRQQYAQNPNSEPIKSSANTVNAGGKATL
jgi:hypothetical protein